MLSFDVISILPWNYTIILSFEVEFITIYPIVYSISLMIDYFLSIGVF